MTDKFNGVVFDIPLTEPVMVPLVLVIHTGKCSVDSDAVLRQLLQAAIKYNLIDLKVKCAEHLVKNVSVDNAFDVLRFAKQNDIEALRFAAVAFIKENKKRLSENADAMEKLVQTMIVAEDTAN